MSRFGFGVIFFIIFAVNIEAQPNCSQPPPKSNIHQCCMNQLAASDVAGACAAKFPPTDAHAVVGLCFGECLFNASGIAVNGQIQMDKAKSLIGEKYKMAPEFIPIIEQSMIKCEKFVKEKIANGQVTSANGSTCNPLIDGIANCVLLETFVNCPDSKWQNNESCNSVKDFFKVCLLQMKN